MSVSVHLEYLVQQYSDYSDIQKSVEFLAYLENQFLKYRTLQFHSPLVDSFEILIAIRDEF